MKSKKKQHKSLEVRKIRCNFAPANRGIEPQRISLTLNYKNKK